MSFITRYLVPIASIVSQISSTSISYLSTRIVSTSKIGLLTCYHTISGLVYTGISWYKGDIADIKTVNKKDIIGIIAGMEAPFLLSEYCMFKMMEKQVILPNAIFSLYPIVNLAKERLSSKVVYKLLENELVVSKSRNILNKEALQELTISVLYFVSVLMIYYGKQEEDLDESEKSSTETIIFACCAMFLESIVSHSTNKYGSKYSPEILVQLGIVMSIPALIVITSILYTTLDSMSLYNDFFKNDFDITKILGISCLNLISMFTYNYALSYTDFVSDCTLLLVITSSIFSMILENGLNYEHYTNLWISGGVSLSVISCISLMLVHKIYASNQENKFVNIIVQQINNSEENFIISKLLDEWKDNQDVFDTINQNKETKLDLENYNEVVLLLLSKLTHTRFIIKDKNNEIKLIISTKNKINERDIVIKIEYDVNNFTNQIIHMSYTDTIEIYPSFQDLEDVELELMGNILDRSIIMEMNEQFI